MFMSTKDPRVDRYIENAAEFARPVLLHLRELIHDAAPEVEETLKWGIPHFMHNGIVCSMAAFRQHCAFTFWHGQAVLAEDSRREGAMGQFGRITGIEDLPPREILMDHVRRAVEYNASAPPGTTRTAGKRSEPEIPDAFRLALESDSAARAAFDQFSPSQRREYVEWIADAKRDATRERRIRTALEWISEGKPRNWKYMGKGG